MFNEPMHFFESCTYLSRCKNTNKRLGTAEHEKSMRRTLNGKKVHKSA